VPVEKLPFALGLIRFVYSCHNGRLTVTAVRELPESAERLAEADFWCGIFGVGIFGVGNF
jgi:hypothetical protein